MGTFVPADADNSKFKGYYSKIAREVIAKLNSHGKSGYYEEQDERTLTGVYNALISIVRHEKLPLDVSIDRRGKKIWLKKV